MSPHPLSLRFSHGHMTVAIGALLAISLTAPAFARPHMGGGGGGGNIGGHFSGTVHFSGGGVHPSGGGGHRPVPPHPHPGPHPHPHPGPHPHPPGPPPHPHPAWWIPGVVNWSDDWDTTTVVYVLPGNCHVVHVNSIKYAECGSTWYEMVYHGTQLAYLPVPDPR